MEVLSTGTASVMWNDKNGNTQVRVYSAEGDTNITEYLYNGEGWYIGTHFTGDQASAVHWSDSVGDHVRVFVANGGQVLLWAQDNGGSWYAGQSFPGDGSSACLANTAQGTALMLFITNAGQITEWYANAQTSGNWVQGSFDPS